MPGPFKNIRLLSSLKYLVRFTHTQQNKGLGGRTFAYGMSKRKRSSSDMVTREFTNRFPPYSGEMFITDEAAHTQGGDPTRKPTGGLGLEKNNYP